MRPAPVSKAIAGDRFRARAQALADEGLTDAKISARLQTSWKSIRALMLKRPLAPGAVNGAVEAAPSLNRSASR